MLIVHAAHSRLIVLDEQMHIQKEEEKKRERSQSKHTAAYSVYCGKWKLGWSVFN